MNDEEKQLEELMKAEEELEKRGDGIKTDTDDSRSDSDSGNSETEKRTKKKKRLRKPRKMLSSSDSESDADETPSVPFQVPPVDLSKVCDIQLYVTYLCLNLDQLGPTSDSNQESRVSNNPYCFRWTMCARLKTNA